MPRCSWLTSAERVGLGVVPQLDVVVESGNPADSARFVPMLERHVEYYGKAPRQCATDGSYASQDNLTAAKALGVEDVAFHKKRGLKVEA